jgi:hypothetical protein
MTPSNCDVRFTPKSGHCRVTLGAVDLGITAGGINRTLWPKVWSSRDHKRTHALQQLILSLRQVLPDFRQ